MFKKFINYFKPEIKEKQQCDRCKEIGVKREAVYKLEFNGFEILICQHHMQEFIETLQKDKNKIDLLKNITLEEK